MILGAAFNGQAPPAHDAAAEPFWNDIDSAEGKALDLRQRFGGECHFGGTADPINPINVSGPFYLAFHEGLGGPNLGGDGGALLDLAADTIDWSCG